MSRGFVAIHTEGRACAGAALPYMLIDAVFVLVMTTSSALEITAGVTSVDRDLCVPSSDAAIDFPVHLLCYSPDVSTLLHPDLGHVRPIAKERAQHIPLIVTIHRSGTNLTTQYRTPNRHSKSSRKRRRAIVSLASIWVVQRI